MTSESDEEIFMNEIRAVCARYDKESDLEPEDMIGCLERVADELEMACDDDDMEDGGFLDPL